MVSSFLCVSRTTRWPVATIQSCHWDINPLALKQPRNVRCGSKAPSDWVYLGMDLTQRRLRWQTHSPLIDGPPGHQQTWQCFISVPHWINRGRKQTCPSKGVQDKSEPGMLIKQKWQLCPKLCWDSSVVRSHDLKLLLKIRVFSRWRHPQQFGLC